MNAPVNKGRGPLNKNQQNSGAATADSSQMASGLLQLRFVTLGFILAISLFSTIFLVQFSRLEFTFALSVVGLALAFVFLTLVTFRNNKPALPEVVSFTFFLAFVWFAPLLQLLDNPRRLVNTATFNNETAAMTNLVISLFVVVYASVIATGKQHDAVPPMPKTLVREFRSTFVLVFFTLVTGIVAVLALLTISDAPGGSSGAVFIFVKKFIWFLPAAIFLLALGHLRTTGGQIFGSQAKLGLGVLVLMAIFTVLTQNPMTEKRNALGPVYLSLFFFVFPAFFSSKLRQLIVVFAAIFLAFPLVAIITHARHGSGADVPLLDVIKDHFYSIHYDSWANVFAMVDMVAMRGVALGEQLLGALLFFVPSQWWLHKPKATGIVVGDYLTEHYAMWFNNLSAPLMGEAYFDFHIFGVALYAFAFGKMVQFIGLRTQGALGVTSHVIGVYMAFFLALVLRGSLMVAIAFAAATVVAFLVADRLVFRRIPQQGVR